MKMPFSITMLFSDVAEDDKHRCASMAMLGRVSALRSGYVEVINNTGKGLRVTP